MGQIIDWLVEDEQKELFQIVWAAVISVLFLALAAPLLWLMGRGALTLRLAKGCVVLWIVLYVTGGVLKFFQGVFRVNIYDRSDAYVGSNLAVGGCVQAGWSAFAALAVGGAVAGAPTWAAVALYAVGAVSCYVAFGVVSSFYTGHLYKFVNLALGQAAFVLFSLWPASARALFGWFINLF